MLLRRETCKAARALLGWTAAQLSEKVGMSAAAINSFETGRTISLNTESQNAIIQAFTEGGVSIIPENGGGQGVKFTENIPDKRLTEKKKPGPKASKK